MTQHSLEELKAQTEWVIAQGAAAKARQHLSVDVALESLTHLTECRCEPASCEPAACSMACHHDYRADVDRLRGALGRVPTS